MVYRRYHSKKGNILWMFTETFGIQLQLQLPMQLQFHSQKKFRHKCLFRTPTNAHLDTRVANGTAAQIMKGSHLLQNVIGQNERFTLKETLVSVGVHADGKSGNLAGLEGRDPVLGEGGDGGGQAGGESTSGQHGDIDVSVGVGHG